MHELSLATGIVLALIDLMRREGLSRIKEVDVEVCEVAQLDKSVLLDALKTLSSEHGLEGVKFNLIDVQAKLRCRMCGAEISWRDLVRSIEELQDEHESPAHISPALALSYVRCPSCGSADLDVDNLFDVRIRRVVGER